MSKFHKYSPMNIYWILSQKKDATQIAGFKTSGRSLDVMLSKERNLRVLAPVKHSKEVEMEKIDPKTNKPYIKDGKVVTEVQKMEWISYRAVPVFDR